MFASLLRLVRPQTQTPAVPPMTFDPASRSVSVDIDSNTMTAGPLDGVHGGTMRSSINGKPIDLTWQGYDTRWFGKPIQVPGAPPNPALAGAAAANDGQRPTS
jgi:hypothetical protein